MLGDSVIQAMVGTARPDAAKAFYTDVLGLKLIAEDQFALVFVGKIGFLRIAKAPAVAPSAMACLTFVVDNVTGVADALASKGVRFERFAFLQQDQRGLWSAPDGSTVGWFRDPDLNLLSIMQPGG